MDIDLVIELMMVEHICLILPDQDHKMVVVFRGFDWFDRFNNRGLGFYRTGYRV